MASDQSGFDEAMQMALAGLAGAADETSFGLLEKYVPAVQRLHKENPGSFATGQVGSYFIPGTGIIGGAKAIRNVFRLGKGAKLASGPGLSLLRRIIQGTIKGAAAGGIEAGGQVAVRKALGTSDNSDVAGAAKSGAAWGAGLGAVSPVLGSIARRVYSHPTIFNPKSPKSPELMQKLMNEGVWGSENTFRKKAASAKGKYNEILDPYRKEIANKRTDINDLFESGYADREFDKSRLGLSAAPQFEKTRLGTKERLGTRPKMGEIDELLSTVNKELSSLQPQKRMQAITGMGGSASNEDQALGALKSSIEELQKKAIVKGAGEKGAADIARAKESYGTGRELERALDRPESLTQAFKSALPVPAAAGALGGLVGGTVGVPAIATGLAVGGATAAARSLPGRTGMGVALNKIGQSPVGLAAKAGRGVEAYDRTNQGGGNVELIDPSRLDQNNDEDFMQFVPKGQQSAKFNERITPEARAASAKQLRISPEALDMIKNPEDEQKISRAKAVMDRQKKQPKRVEQSMDNEENPFLQFVPAR